MISFTELLHGHVVTDLTIAEQHNLEDLQRKVNIIREAWGKPMTVTSGFRTEQDQLRINPKAPNSAHRSGKAVDIQDTDGSLRNWVLKNLDLMQQQGLYMEDFRYTKGWVHFSSQPPKSGHRIFVPYSGPAPNSELWDGKYDSKYDN
jgi:hypothetical protein